MSSEKCVSLKKLKKLKRSETEKICVIHNERLSKHGELKDFTETSWKKVCDSKIARLQCDNPKTRQIEICDQIPETLNNTEHGYHRPCYQVFTNLRDCRPPKRQSNTEEENYTPRKRCMFHQAGTLLPSDKCIICKRQNKYVKRKLEGLTKCVTETAKNSITQAAHFKSDSYIISLAETHCLIAQEAHYHESCRRYYVKNTNWREATATPANQYQKQLEEAHDRTFTYICNYVEKQIIENSNVERMTMIKEKYLEYLKTHHPEFYNPNYKTYKLKDRLQKKLGAKIQFWQPNYKSELVYSNDIPKGAAVETAFESASSDERRLQEAALVLRRVIFDTYSVSQTCPWPPSSEYLLSKTEEMPVLLTSFMSSLLSSKIQKADRSERLERIIMSLCQDICYNVTCGRWKTAKHLLLGMTLRHTTGSAKIIKLLNRFGHSISHSCLLELETAMCDSVSECASSLPAGATTQAPFTHFCWDNFDMAEETPSGAGTTHSTHGIIIQEQCNDQASTQSVSSSSTQTCNSALIQRSKKRSSTYVPPHIDPYFDTGLSEPTFEVRHTSFDYKHDDFVEKSFFHWMLCRLDFNKSYNIPGWKGWLSAATMSQKETKSLIHYMPPINASVNELSTVKQILQVSQDATKETGQSTTFVTFDLAVARKAYALIWQNPESYKHVFVHLGVFHTMMSYLGAVGKLMKGSGLEEIVIEAGLCASGSLEKVLAGKHYNRAMRVHTHVLEALERLLFASFLQNTGSGELLKDFHSKAKEIEHRMDPSLVQNIISSEALTDVFAQYQVFKQQTAAGNFGKTAQFWMHYMDRVWLLLQFSFATKTNNLDLHIFCLQRLCPLVFSMNHQNYAKYLSVYFTTLVNLPQKEKDLLLANGFSVARSETPASRIPVDMTIEQTINKHAKSSGGIVGFSRNLPAYYRWCVTRHNRAQYVSAAYQLANIESKNSEYHKESNPSERKLSENAVRKTVETFIAFTNPFEVEREHLVCLSSGQKLPDDIADDLLKVEEVGKSSFEMFVKDRLQDKTTKFHTPLQKTKLKTFLTVSKSTTVKSSNSFVKIKAQRNVFGQLLVLSQEHGIDMEKVLTYPLSPVPWSLASPDGMPLKTNKATLMKALEKGYLENNDFSKLPNTTSVVDGNALFHCLNAGQDTFGDLAKQAFRSLPQTSSVHFVTDSYKIGSIKSCERLRRGASSVHSYVLQGPATKVPRNFKEFLSNDENKKNFIRFLLSEWTKDQYSVLLKNREIYFVCEERCYLITSDNTTVNSIPVPQLFSSHEEADSRIILHCIYASQQPEVQRIVVRSPDTDVFLLLLSFVDKYNNRPIIFDTGSGNNRRQVNISKLFNNLSKQLCDAILGLHAFTGCDSTSCFAGKGKLKALKLLKENTNFQNTFSRLGKSSDVCQMDQKSIETFVCKLYGKTSHTSVNKVRYDKMRQSYKGRKSLLTSSKGLDLSKMPPCQDVLLLHTQRANYQTQIWRASYVTYPDLPAPEDNGWKLSSSGSLEIQWYTNNFIPKELQEILPDSMDQEDDEEQEEIAFDGSDDDDLSSEDDDIWESDNDS